MRTTCPYRAIFALLIIVCFAVKPTLSVARKPLRIVSVNGTLSEILVGLGLESQIVGVDVTSTYPASLDKIPKVGHNRSISAEGILSLNPDVIVVSDQSMLSPTVTKQLGSTGKKVLMFKQELSQAGTVRLIREMGAYFNAKVQAEKMVKTIQTDLAKLPKAAAPKKLLFIYARGTGTLMVSGRNTSPDKMFSLIGHKNAVTDFADFKPLTSESLLAANPDVLVLFSSGLESVDGIEGLLKVSGIAYTNAGKNKKIVSMDGQLLTGFGPRLGKAATELALKVQ